MIMHVLCFCWSNYLFLIQYYARLKILLFTHKVLNNVALGYLIDQLCCYRPDWLIRSSEEVLLRVPRLTDCHLAVTRRQAFSVMMPVPWNARPPEIHEVPTVTSFRYLVPGFPSMNVWWIVLLLLNTLLCFYYCIAVLLLFNPFDCKSPVSD